MQGGMEAAEGCNSYYYTKRRNMQGGMEAAEGCNSYYFISQQV
jgi:hypothetical protein